MNEFENYRMKANRTRVAGEIRSVTMNVAMGLAGETGEVIDVLKKILFHGKPLDRTELMSEIGDVLFYLDWLASLHGMTLQEVADANIIKLLKRYPDGFKHGGGHR